MEQISPIGMDASKHSFQLHGANATEKVVLHKKLRRKEMEAFFEKLAPTVIGIEASGASHHWARLLRSFGHEVKLIAAQLVKPYVKRGKNDAIDAEALCEAMSRGLKSVDSLSTNVPSMSQRTASNLTGRPSRPPTMFTRRFRIETHSIAVSCLGSAPFPLRYAGERPPSKGCP